MPVWATALLGVATFVVGSLVSAVWLLAGINKDVERMKTDIGTSEAGMRYQGVKNSIELTTLQAQFTALQQRVEGLHKWKHDIGEAYLPRAVDEHERRLNRLDAKVFNGGSHHP
jgi:hypothetical protein